MDTNIFSEKGINGYIQEIDYTPFGFLLYSEIQVSNLNNYHTAVAIHLKQSKK